MIAQRIKLQLVVFISICAAAQLCYAQATKPAPSSSPAPVERDEQDAIKVFTEEVLLPVAAYNDYGFFDPSVELNDILVLEDNVAQQVRSVRRLPSSILIVIDMGSQITATGSSNATREVVLKLVGGLHAADQVAVIQNSNRVELLQDWTTDAQRATHILKTQFFTSNRSRLSECLMMAAAQLKNKSPGTTHVVVFTDGLEDQSRQVGYKSAVKRLIATQASLHVFSFAALVEQVVRRRNGPVIFGGGGSRLLTIDTDFEMRRWFQNYARAARQNEQRLVALAQDAGGRIFMPQSTAEIVKNGIEVARDIGAQYVVSYTPARPFASIGAAQTRRVSVFPRRAGLRLLALRNSVSNPNR